MTILLLCWEFFKIGLFAIGGGMAAIPFLMQMSEKYPHWFTMEQLVDMIAISESTPGPIGINMATYVGYNVAGVAGGMLASLSLVLPAFIIITAIAGVLEKWRTNRFVVGIFAGLRPAVTGLIAAAGYSVLKIALVSNGAVSWPAVIMLLVLFACTQTKRLGKLHPIIYIAVAAVMGIILKL